MNIFEAEPDHVVRLSSLQLVQLLKRLLYAECSLTGIALRSAFVPMQITVADGGEDGRVEWVGGTESTGFLPARFSLFQSKAQNLTPGLLTQEVLLKRPAKTTRRKSARKKRASKSIAALQIKPALKEVFAKKGAYVVFCSNAFTGQKIQKLKKAIADAIKSARKNPARITIDVYDAIRYPSGQTRCRQ